MTEPQPKSTLSTGKYTIELDRGATQIFAQNEMGLREWVASTTDPNRAMEIVEGLVLVEMKRFYHPDSQPSVKSEGENPVPPFLRKNR